MVQKWLFSIFEGFDTHTAQGTDNGEHADNLHDIDLIIKNLHTGMGSDFNNTLILTLTEFGRTVEQNGGNGTEHGYGSAILMAGGLLKKSQVFTDWPGLKKIVYLKEEILTALLMPDQYMLLPCQVYLILILKIKREVFWEQNIKNYSENLFKS